ncbi:hypothetical protein INR49_001750, partial [Caranx melampygus]
MKKCESQPASAAVAPLSPTPLLNKATPPGRRSRVSIGRPQKLPSTTEARGSSLVGSKKTKTLKTEMLKLPSTNEARRSLLVGSKKTKRLKTEMLKLPSTTEVRRSLLVGSKKTKRLKTEMLCSCFFQKLPSTMEARRRRVKTK